MSMVQSDAMNGERRDAEITQNCFQDTVWTLMTPGFGIPEANFIKITYHPLIEQYELCWSAKRGPEEWIHVQDLVYNYATRMLENLADQRERCIAFWPRKLRNGATRDCIFAMRMRSEEVSPMRWPDLAPFEQRKVDGGWAEDGDGSWGAEEEGGG